MSDHRARADRADRAIRARHWVQPHRIAGSDRPARLFDPMTQHERTALAWERTAIATMVGGTLFARYARDVHWILAVVGVLEVAVGAALLIWTGVRYESLHGPLRRGESPVHPAAAKVVGATTIAFIGFALVVAIATR